MAYYPVNLDLNNRKCVVVGGGTVAERKIETLLEFGALIVVVAPELTPKLCGLTASGVIEHIPELYASETLEHAFLVIAATDNRSVNTAVSSDAQRRGIPVNVVDDPELCTFIVPSVIRHGDMVISISTSGNSPSMSRHIREKLEPQFGPEYGDLADLLGELRGEIKARFTTMADRNAAYKRILESDVLELLAHGKRDEALDKARKCI